MAKKKTTTPVVTKPATIGSVTPTPVTPKRRFGRVRRVGRWLKRKWWLFLILIILLVGGGVYYQKSQAAIPTLTFIQPERKDLTKTLDVSCTVDAKERARLRFLAGGKVVYIGAKEGDVVKKYQTLATIDKRQLEKQLSQELNRYMQERWDWEQTLDNTKDRTLPEDEQRAVDKQQWDLTNKVLDVEIKDITVRESSITSPIAGILTTSPSLVSGVQLSPSDYFEVVNPATLVCKAAVDEVDIAPVVAGLPATVTLDSYPDEDLPSNISFISVTSSRAETGTVFVVEIPLPAVTKLDKYRLGMNGDVAIELEKKYDVLTIPLSTTRDKDGKTVVDVKTGENTYEAREIQVGMQTDDEVEVIGGLSESDEILLPES